MNDTLSPMDAAIKVQTRLQALLGRFDLQRVLIDQGAIRVTQDQDCEPGRLLRFELDIRADCVPHTVTVPLAVGQDGLISVELEALAAWFFAEVGRFVARAPELLKERRRLRGQVDQAIALAAESGLDLELLGINWTAIGFTGQKGWEVAMARYGRSGDEIRYDVFYDRVDGGDIDGFASNFTQGGLQEQLRLAKELGPVMIVADDR